MHKKALLLLISAQAALTLLEVYLISKISLIGRVGIALFYKEYRLLRSGWKTFLLFFAAQLLIIGLLQYMKQKTNPRRTIYTAAGIILIALLGLFANFYDFQYTYSHRLLKERFHLGFYLFWLSMIGSGICYIVSARNTKSPETEINEITGNAGV